MSEKDRQFILGILLTFIGYHFTTTFEGDTESNFKIGLSIFTMVIYTIVMIKGIRKVLKNLK